MNRLKRHTSLFNIQQVAQRPEWEVIQPVDKIDFPWDDKDEANVPNVGSTQANPGLGNAA
jgi:hypothetical protein